MITKKVTRQLSCNPLGLPPDLPCNHCIPSVTKSLIKGIAPTRINKRSQTWLPKMGTPAGDRESASTYKSDQLSR